MKKKKKKIFPDIVDEFRTFKARRPINAGEFVKVGDIDGSDDGRVLGIAKSVAVNLTDGTSEVVIEGVKDLSFSQENPGIITDGYSYVGQQKSSKTGLYVALFCGDPRFGGREPFGVGYKRQPINKLVAIAPFEETIAHEIVFGPALGQWEQVDYFAITGQGMPVGTLPSPVRLKTNDKYVIPANSISFRGDVSATMAFDTTPPPTKEMIANMRKQVDVLNKGARRAGNESRFKNTMDLFLGKKPKCSQCDRAVDEVTVSPKEFGDVELVEVTYRCLSPRHSASPYTCTYSSSEWDSGVAFPPDVIVFPPAEPEPPLGSLYGLFLYENDDFIAERMIPTKVVDELRPKKKKTKNDLKPGIPLIRPAKRRINGE